MNTTWKKLALLTIGVILILSVMGCSQATATPTPKASPVLSPSVSATPSNSAASPTQLSQSSTRMITDLVGHQVAIPTTINRIGALVGPGYDKVLILGGIDKMVSVGVSPLPWAVKFYPAMAAIPAIKNPQTPNVEDLIKQKVDAVFFWDLPANIKPMTDAGIPVIVTQLGSQTGPQTQQKYLDLFRNEVRIFANVLGPEAQKRADEYLDYYDSIVNRVTTVTSKIPANERPKVYYVRGPNPLTTHLGFSNTFWYVTMAGGEMVTKDLTNGIMADVTMEQVVNWNPDIILMGRVATTDPILKDAKWSNIKAVTDGKVYVNPGGAFYSDYGSEGALLLLYLARTFYPDRFADIDMVKETKYFYSHFYGYQLTDDEANRIILHQDPAK